MQEVSEEAAWSVVRDVFEDIIKHNDPQKLRRKIRDTLRLCNRGVGECGVDDAKATVLSIMSEAVYWCVRDRQHACLKVLLDESASPNYQTSSNACTAVGMAAEKDDPESLRLLLQAKALPAAC